MMQFKFLSFRWLKKWLDRQLERSFQRQADRLFNKGDVKYRDGDNT